MKPLVSLWSAALLVVAFAIAGCSNPDAAGPPSQSDINQVTDKIKSNSSTGAGVVPADVHKDLVSHGTGPGGGGIVMKKGG